MRGTRRLTMWWRALVARRAVEAELDEELRFHLDMETAKLGRAGLPPDAARRRALLAFGGVERHKEALRDGRGVRGLERAAHDLRVAARGLRRTPGFAVAAMLTLALGIGGNAAVFGVVHGVLLRPLPYPDADRLVTIGHRTRGGDLPERVPNSSAAHVVYEAGSRSFAAMAIYEADQASLTGDGAEPAWVDVVRTTRSLFDVLRVAPMLGRTFTAEEDRPGGPRVVVLGHAAWRTRFGGDPAVVGRVVTLDGIPRQVVGVMPPRFAFPTPDAQFWMPMQLDREHLGGFNIAGIGRLRDGVTPETAARELQQLLPRVSEVVSFMPPSVLRDGGIRPDVHPYADDVVGGVRPALLTLWAMMGLVLLIACVNVASLLLVRAEARRREIVLRVALGAERGHLLAQFLAESTVLLLLGTAAGVALARVALWLLPRVAPAALPRMGEIGVDGTVLLVTAATAAVAALAFGAIPLARIRRAAPAAVLRGDDRAATHDRRTGRVRQLLVVSQVAMATVLLVGSGLALRSLQKLRAVEPGFQADEVLTFRIALPGARYETPEDVARFHAALLERVRALPGVVAAGATGELPLAGPSSRIDPLRVEGVAYTAGALPPIAEMRIATPGYFAAMGIPLLAGRELTRADAERRSGAVVVSEAVVRTQMASRPPLGARVAHGLPDMEGQNAWSDVVGVAGDVHGVSLHEPPIGAVYYAMHNRPGVDMDWLARSMVYAVRSDLPPATLLPALRRAVRALDPALPLAETRTLRAVVAAAEAEARFTMAGLTVAAAVGLFMGAIGLYGVLSYVAVQRTREIGVRIALGATPRSVRLAVLRSGLLVSGAGLLVGLLAAIALRGLATPVLFGIGAADPATFVGVSLVLLGVGALATWLPARRAARLDPVRALRWE